MRSSNIDQFVRVVAAGPCHRVEINTTGTPFAVTRDGIKAVNQILDQAPGEYAIFGARRERVPAGALDARVQYAGRLDVPGGEDSAAIATLIADDLRDALALPGHLIRIDLDASAAAA